MKLSKIREKMPKSLYIMLRALERLKRRINAIYTVLREKQKKKNVYSTDYDLNCNIKLFYYQLGENIENLGDYLSTVVVDYFKPVNGIVRDEGVTLFAIGSILGFRCQDAVVWGSGMISSRNERYKQRIKHSSLDIRAVRGPKTREQLIKLGKKCPEVYGDPAILMPDVFFAGRMFEEI